MACRVQYWFSTASPWAWLGSRRFIDLAAQAQALVEVLPIDLGVVFADTGGVPFHQRSPARQSYRQLELSRWSRRLEVPINLVPRFYPVDRAPSSKLLIAARIEGLDAHTLSHAILQAVWVQDRNIADWETLDAVANEAGLGRDAQALVRLAQQPRIHDEYLQGTRRAVEAEVFGSPTYTVEGERYWGQDRLDFLADRLLRG